MNNAKVAKSRAQSRARVREKTFPPSKDLTEVQRAIFDLPRLAVPFCAFFATASALLLREIDGSNNSFIFGGDAVYAVKTLYLIAVALTLIAFIYSYKVMQRIVEVLINDELSEETRKKKLKRAREESFPWFSGSMSLAVYFWIAVLSILVIEL